MQLAHYHHFSYTDGVTKYYRLFCVPVMSTLNLQTSKIDFTFMLLCIVIDFFLNNQPDALIIQIYSVIKLYMFRESSLPIIRSFLLYIRHCQVTCRFLRTASKQSQDGTAVPSWLCLETVIKNLHETYHCRMYSRKLLMMGSGDARNMQSFITE
jgi:hypothetical protein